MASRVITLMAFKIKHPFWQTVGLGTVAGMRTFSAPAITSHILSHHHSKKLAGSNLRFMENNTVASALKVLAVLEFVGDKMPSAPARIKPAGLIGRVAAGMLAGASIYKASGNQPLVGTVIGGVSALASTFACYFIRKQTVKHARIIDPIVGAIEDALVLGAGLEMVATAT